MLVSFVPDQVLINGIQFNVGDESDISFACKKARENAKAAGLTTRGGRPKFNNALYGVSFLTERLIRAGITEDGMTIAFQMKDAWKAVYGKKDKVLHFNGTDEEQAQVTGTLLTILALTDGGYEWSKKSLKQYASSSPAASVSVQWLAMYCDAVYYESRVNGYNEAVRVVKSDEIVSTFYDKADVLTKFELELWTPEPIEGANGVTKTEMDALRREEVLGGKYVIDYPWAPEVRETIPPLDILERFWMSPTYWDIVNVLKYRLRQVLDRISAGASRAEVMAGAPLNILLHGEAGTGKSTMARAICATFGLPYAETHVQGHSEEDTFTTRTVADEGVLKRVPAAFQTSFRLGGGHNIEELNNMDPSIISGTLNPAIEAPYTLDVDHVKFDRHPLMVVFGCCNLGLPGTKTQNHAFFSRFTDQYYFDEPTEEEAKSKLRVRLKLEGEDDERIMNAFYNVYIDLRNYVRNPANELDDTLPVVTERALGAAIEKFKMLVGSEPMDRRQAYASEFASSVMSRMMAPIIGMTAGDPVVRKNLMTAFEDKLKSGLKYHRMFAGGGE